MLQADVVVVNTPEEFEEALTRFLTEVQAAESTNPFESHAKNLESLADDIQAGMDRIAANTNAPAEAEVDEALLQDEMGLATATELLGEALRLQAAAWRKAGASK